jgi:DNA-binding PadR family transcriptional regulator
MRRTVQLAVVLGALADAAPGPLYGLDLIRRTGLASGTLYPLLARLDDEGLVRSSWENSTPREDGRPRRRYYWITHNGETILSQLPKHLIRAAIALRMA